MVVLFLYPPDLKNADHDIKQLLSRLKQDDEPALEALYNIYQHHVYEIAMKYTGHADELAQEILQDVFLKVWLKRNELDGIVDFPSWLYTVTKNRAFSVLRGIALVKTGEKELSAHYAQQYTAGFEQPGEKMEGEAFRQLIAEAAATLTPNQRMALQLIREQGMSRAEAAEVMGLSPNTVKMHLLAATRGMRAHLILKGVIIPSVLAAYPVFIF